MGSSTRSVSTGTFVSSVLQRAGEECMLGNLLASWVLCLDVQIGRRPRAEVHQPLRTCRVSGGEDFFDTNVVLYLLSADTAKADRAEELLALGGTISVQVLNEFAAVASRKLLMSWAEIREVLAQIRAVCAVEPMTIETHDRALRVAERYGLSIYDALIVSAALLANCKTLHSEDMQDGQVVERQLTIRNPFTSS
jgi:predicted nucleic acid-binding protein